MTDAVAISTERGVAYPAAGPFSPPEVYPEYPFRNHGGEFVSPGNRVYALVRRVLQESGADAARFGTPEWNPLGGWIRRGQRVFLLANLVMNRRQRETPVDFSSKCTHASVVRAVLDYATIATGDAGLVSFGNAPIQACDYDTVSAQTGASELSAFYARAGYPDVGPHDLRVVLCRARFGAILERRTIDGAARAPIDLGADSLLEAHYRGTRTAEFRVADYPGSETMSHHGQGRHVYVLNRRVLDADVIISVPKLKTHSRVGITCALKGTVGAIANKECLAHHRLGPPEREGDEYPEGTWLRDLSSLLMDRADSVGTSLPANAFRVASKVLNRSLKIGGRGFMSGSWYGNDTCWRMSLDIARILRFADRDGRLQPSPVRPHLALVDGIVGGEGEGPLKGTARHSGAVVFGSDAALVDAACTLLMGFDPAKIPIVARAFGIPTFPVTDSAPSDLRVLLDGARCEPGELPGRFAPYRPPAGWRGHMEYTNARSPSSPATR
jgi:uncharacterized protein (DUF362 family)